jgi:hypothetical protein
LSFVKEKNKIKMNEECKKKVLCFGQQASWYGWVEVTGQVVCLVVHLLEGFDVVGGACAGEGDVFYGQGEFDSVADSILGGDVSFDEEEQHLFAGGCGGVVEAKNGVVLCDVVRNSGEDVLDDDGVSVLDTFIVDGLGGSFVFNGLVVHQLGHGHGDGVWFFAGTSAEKKHKPYTECSKYDLRLFHFYFSPRGSLDVK